MPNQWAKFKVVLEETDLCRLLRDAELPLDLAARIPLRTAYQLLELEAEILILVKIIGRFNPPSQDDAHAKLLGYEEQKARLILQLRGGND